jgi:hypothetical protein
VRFQVRDRAAGQAWPGHQSTSFEAYGTASDKADLMHRVLSYLG